MSVEQYKAGTVTVTNGSAVVTGLSTLWAASIVAGAAFKLDLDGDPTYVIASVDSDTQITLSANYAGETSAGETYMIQRSFTLKHNLARIFQGDADSADILRELLIDKLDRIINGMLTVDTTQYSTPADTSENDAISYAMPANTMNINGRMVRVKIWGKTAANGNTKTIKLYFGAAIVATLVTTANNKAWLLEGDVVRTGSATEKAFGRSSADTEINVDSDDLTEDTTAAITIKVTAQNGTASAADIVVEGMTIEILN